MPFSRFLVGIKASFLSPHAYFSGLDCEIQNCLKSFSHPSSPHMTVKNKLVFNSRRIKSINGVTSNITLLVLLVTFFNSPGLLEWFKQGGVRLVLVNISIGALFPIEEFWQK